MRQKFDVGGITFYCGFGRVVVKEYLKQLTVKFNCGSLSAVDSIRWNITRVDDSTGAEFEELKFESDYQDIELSLSDYFTSRFTAKGRYSLYIQCLKGTTFVDGFNCLFWYSNYSFYQMGFTFPNRCLPVFAPCVYKYSTAGLHVDSTTQKAEYVEFEAAGYSERRKVYDGVCTFDAQAFLQQLFNDVDPWQFQDYEFNDYMKTSPLVVSDSLVIKLLNAKGDVIDVCEDALDAFYSVGTFFMRTNVKAIGGNFRSRMIWYNLPHTVENYQDEGNGDVIGYNNGIRFVMKNKVIGSGGTVFYDFGYSTKTFNRPVVSVNVKSILDWILDIDNCNVSSYDLIKAGFYIMAEHPINSAGDSVIIGIDPEFSAETRGIYIRWISRWGEHCYWLFTKGEETSETKAISTFKRSDESFNEREISNVETTRTIKVGDIVKQKYIDFLCGFADGWGHQMYNQEDGSWTPINVLDAKVSVGKQASGNKVEFEIEVPQLNVKF